MKLLVCAAILSGGVAVSTQYPRADLRGNQRSVLTNKTTPTDIPPEWAAGVAVSTQHPRADLRGNQQLVLTNKTLPKDIPPKWAKLQLRGRMLVSMLLILVFVLFLLMFFMVSTKNQELKRSAWSSFDTTNITIIGMLLYRVIADAFTDVEVLIMMANSQGIVHQYWIKASNILLHMIYAVLIFVAAIFAAHKFKDSPKNLKVFNAVIYWCILTAKSGALGEATTGFGRGSLTWTVQVTCIGLVFYMILLVVTHHIKPQPRWWDAEENHVMGGVAAAVVCSSVNLLIHILLRRRHGYENIPGWEEALYSNCFAISTVLLMVFTSQPLHSMMKRHEDAEHDDEITYWKWRFLQYLQALIGMLPYFAFSIGIGHAICNHLQLMPTTAMAKIIHTGANTVNGIACILVVAYAPYLNSGTEHSKVLAGFLNGFGGYQAGYAWSILLTDCGPNILHASKFPDGTNPLFINFAQAAMCLFLLSAHVPVYINFIKPAVDKRMEECSAK